METPGHAASRLTARKEELARADEAAHSLEELEAQHIFLDVTAQETSAKPQKSEQELVDPGNAVRNLREADLAKAVRSEKILVGGRDILVKNAKEADARLPEIVKARDALLRERDAIREERDTLRKSLQTETDRSAKAQQGLSSALRLQSIAQSDLRNLEEWCGDIPQQTNARRNYCASSTPNSRKPLSMLRLFGRPLLRKPTTRPESWAKCRQRRGPNP